jgi:hypothetical protein
MRKAKISYTRTVAKMFACRYLPVIPCTEPQHPDAARDEHIMRLRLKYTYPIVALTSKIKKKYELSLRL